ncbi:glycoside hydrolase family 78 protein [Vararia minispora EC-137]|uniref:Glycoside hydrolase family 78 protein n=1 Tax=Vararia minispora EC-137 TaxID=1314806 RepID=A0ACB8QBL5_9AGAM|nr:glycoside hydrolase family 78 protein [Vararia minispora EC-137]
MWLQYTAVLAVLAGLAHSSAPAGPWDAFNYAPSSKTVFPSTIREQNGSVAVADSAVGSVGAITLSGNWSWVTLDFGKEVGGLISMNFNNVTNSSAVALSFTESPIFIRPWSSDDSSTPSSIEHYDGVMHVLAPLPSGLWTQDAMMLRGGFRFLTIASNSSDDVTFSNVSCAISFMPHVERLDDYAGYFYTKDPVSSDEDFLTKIWYAGAYTVQTNTVPLNTGRRVPAVSSAVGWANDAALGAAGPIIVDGAKRDRAVWPGDMGIAVPTQFVSTNDLLPTKNALQTMFAGMNPFTGALPESGPPLSQQGSDTYHAWTLIGVHNYWLYSGDDDWIRSIWSNYTKAVRFLVGKVDSSGLVNITRLRDWARVGGGGHNAEGNALYYKVLKNSVDLANAINETALADGWVANATIFKETYNNAFWLASIGMYRDNTTTVLAPQDANSMAVLFNLTLNASQANSVSKGLTVNWNNLGAVAPELPDTISPFIGGLELQAHFESGNDDRAMDLLRREWGYMLYTNLSVESTLLEGFTSNGSLLYRATVGYSRDAAYISHAHGWSSGPTSALTFYVVGLRVTAPQGRSWIVAPHMSGLGGAEGGFATPLGWFGVQWSMSRGEYIFQANITTPEGTEGSFTSPVAGSATVDGESSMSIVNGTVIALIGGSHTIEIAIS